MFAPLVSEQFAPFQHADIKEVGIRLPPECRVRMERGKQCPRATILPGAVKGEIAGKTAAQQYDPPPSIPVRHGRSRPS
jgi:hypothetical protein